MKPLVPEDFFDRNVRSAAITSFCRACIASARSVIEPDCSPAEFVEDHWPDDSIANLLTRAVTSPTTISDGVALTTVTTALVDLLTPKSASAALFMRSIHLSFGTAAQIDVPSV